MSAPKRKRYRVTLVTTASFRGMVTATSEEDACERAEDLWFTDCEQFNMDRTSVECVLAEED